MISKITLDTYKQQISSGDAFNLSDSFNGRVGDEQVPLVVQFTERGLAQQFQDGLVPFLSGFVGSLDENNQVTAETGEAVSYVGTSDDIVGLGRVKMNLPGTMFPQEGYFYGFLGLQNADGKRVTTFNVWFHVYNGNPDMFVNKAPFRTELQKLLDSAQQAVNATNSQYKAEFEDEFDKIASLSSDASNHLTEMISQLDVLQAKINSSDIATNTQLEQAMQNISASLYSEINNRPTNQMVVDMLERGFANFDGGQPHAIDSEATLNSTYPNGHDGVFVTVDTGHMWMWGPNGKWIDGGVYQGVEIKDGSIDASKLAENAQSTIFIPSKDGIPNYDTTSHTFDFMCVNDNAYFMVNNTAVQVPKLTTVKNSIIVDNYTSAKLIYTFDTGKFDFIAWSTPLATNQVMIGGMRLSDKGWYWSGSMDITIDGKQVDQYNIAPNILFSPSSKKLPDFNTTTRVFDFSSYNSTTATLVIGERSIPIPEGTIASPSTGAMNSNTLKLIFNINKKTAQVLGWYEAVPPYSVILATILMNYGDSPIIDGGFPYTINGYDSNLQRHNISFVPSKDGAPIFNTVNNVLDFNCYTDQAYILYNNKVYQLPKLAKISTPQTGSSIRFLINLNTMEMNSTGWQAKVPLGWIEIAAIRKTINNDVLVTANFPITIKGASFKPNATLNEKNAKIIGINHRGFNIVAPEESKSAYLLSKQNGYLHWEGDINWTKDNVPMMIHDLAINRTARKLDGTQLETAINLTDLNYTDLANYDFGVVKGSQYSGEPLLSFEELVKLSRYNDAVLHIEFKYEFTQEQVQALHNIVVKYNMLDRIGWQAFGWDWLKPMMALEPNGQYELLGGDVTDDYFAKMSALKTNTNTIIASQNAALSVDDIQKIADKGYPIYLWTVDDGNTVRKFRDIGMVEGIMTNGSINVADELTK
ncbi:glycerophosphodiester phosphodiesterase family protein [Lactiplantibacillus plantarum]|uniref:glycerophosphodiester phosphodiesterase n=1 Tax=Lactiplantibacillus plantarum TaxID=1590 RepID=UPI003C14E427